MKYIKLLFISFIRILLITIIVVTVLVPAKYIIPANQTKQACVMLLVLLIVDFIVSVLLNGRIKPKRKRK